MDTNKVLVYEQLPQLRKWLISKAKGKVLELGAGNGPNLRYYNLENIEQLTITDMALSKRLTRIESNNCDGRINFQQASVLDLPFENETFDSIVFTLIFCTVPDVARGLAEVRRVLKKDGKIFFIEHVLAKKNPLKVTMQLVTKPFKAIAHGCHLNRDFEKSLLENGFTLDTSFAFFKGIGFSGIARVDE